MHVAKEFSDNDLYELEESVHRGGDCEYWAPHNILELIDEIKRLRGLPVEKWPEEFLPAEPLAPVEFDFSDIFGRRGG